jgi:lipopolysaccharide biosynthesis protein
VQSPPSAKAICFYLPQYHAIPENDEWWGKGFTEWRNVARAVPNFPGHYQPHVPAELGAYDLSDVDVQRKQAALAKEHGIHGFCYYFYWFAGKRVLERPLNQLLEHPEIHQPYCVCWANENWTRTWDGKENDILLAQKHSPEDDEACFRALLPHLKDPRYIRVDGKPMLLVYRVDLFPDARATAERWRRLAEEEGLPGLHLCAVQFYGITDPKAWGFDAAIEFCPHGFIGGENQPGDLPPPSNPRFRGDILDYQKVVAQALRKPPADYRWYRGVTPSWDNTPRRQDTPHLFVQSSPADYCYWLREIVQQTVRVQPPEHRFVFINAWNEWGEGCHLEPDMKYGRAWLEATRSALFGERTLERFVDAKQSTAWDVVYEAFEARERSLYAMADALRRKDQELEHLRSELRDYTASPAHALKQALKRKLVRFPRMEKALRVMWRRLPNSLRITAPSPVKR